MFLNPNQNISNLEIIETVWMVKNNGENVIIIIFVQLIMKLSSRNKKTTLSFFDNKRFYKNETEGKPWN